MSVFLRVPTLQVGTSTEHRAADGANFRLLWAPQPDVRLRRSVALILPGANCGADRYLWLSRLLAGEGVRAAVVEPAPRRRKALLEPRTWVEGRFITVDVVLGAVAVLAAGHCEEVVLIGHSLGGVVALQTIMPEEAILDPDSGVRSPYPVPTPIRRVIAGGTTLEPDIMGVTIPWRTKGTPLRPPAGVPISLIAGGADALIPVAAVRATAERFEPTADLHVLSDVTHFGWTSGHESTDRVDLDGHSPLSREAQQRAIAAVIRTCLGCGGCEHHGS